MSKRNPFHNNMVATKSKNKVLSCSTPERDVDSSPRDSDSICDSEADSPVPFLCTQDGAEGETDVVWNYYTPKSANSASSRIKNSTPLTRKAKKRIKLKLIERPVPKRRVLKPSQKRTELFQELVELNQNLHEFIGKKTETHTLNEKQNSGSEEDIFNDSLECSPKSVSRTNSSLRKKLLNSMFNKPEPETALESDDSMNECLLKASQVVEDHILKAQPTPVKRAFMRSSDSYVKDLMSNYEHDSMDAILNNIGVDVSKVKASNSPSLNNDSFDTLVGNLNESTLEKLTQMPVKNYTPVRKSKDTGWMIKELIVHDGSPSSKSVFGRHNSMPESPSVDASKPSTSGMVFGRYKTMPYRKDNNTGIDDSPIKCTPEEIEKKRQQARDRLLAKRLLPFTSTQQPNRSLPQPTQHATKTQFQPKVASANINESPKNVTAINRPVENSKSNIVDLKLLIEKKRQEALMRLRRRQAPNKST